MTGGVQGGVKFYRGSATAARSYVEADRSRADDYYLAEGTGLADRLVAERTTSGASVAAAGAMDGPAYERWVAGYDVDSGAAKGRLRTDERGLRFVEVVVNGPKSWSLAASIHPEIAAAYDAAQDRAAVEIVGWLASHATTRVGPRGRQVQVPVDGLEAAVVRHYTSRAGDPHRHLHLQINARVRAAGRWRGLHSVGVVDSIEAINGIGHSAIMCDPGFRRALAEHGYTLDPATGEITELAPFASAFSTRAAQIVRNIDRYEAAWRTANPDQEPGPRLRRTWDRRAWAEARPDKVVPTDGTELTRRWREELHDLGFTPPHPAGPSCGPVHLSRPRIGAVDRAEVVDLVLSRLGGRRSAWNAADLRGEVERIIAGADVVAETAVRRELVEDLTARAIEECVPLLDRSDVPEHVRSMTSSRVLEVEADLTGRLAARAESPIHTGLVGPVVARASGLDEAQRAAVGTLTGTGELLVIEGAAGAGKTTTLATAAQLLAQRGHQLMVVTPTLKAARVAEHELSGAAFSAAWLVYQHGYRWDQDGHWTRQPSTPPPAARLRPGDLLLIDEAGMLDQDTARALLTIADETGARVAFLGDRHQLPAVGRGGVLDHAARWAPPEAHRELDTVHRFSDPTYAELSLRMRRGENSAAVFDALLARGQVVIHPTEVQRTAGLAGVDGLIVADTREQVAALNAAISERHRNSRDNRNTPGPLVTTLAGEQIGPGDRIATRRNDRDFGVANRDTWTVTALDDHGNLHVTGTNGQRTLPTSYVREYVELAYATTIHGAQGETVNAAHLLLGETTSAAGAYVAMTRGRQSNTVHIVAGTTDDARAQWVETFSRGRADLGPAHAATTAAETIDRYGPNIPTPRRSLRPDRPTTPPARRAPSRLSRRPSHRIGR